MIKKEVLEGIINFREKLISKRDYEIQQFNEQCENFIAQISSWGIVDVSKFKKRQEEVIKLNKELYKPYLDAIDEKLKEIKDGKFDMYFQI